MAIYVYTWKTNFSRETKLVEIDSLFVRLERKKKKHFQNGEEDMFWNEIHGVPAWSTYLYEDAFTNSSALLIMV